MKSLVAALMLLALPLPSLAGPRIVGVGVALKQEGHKFFVVGLVPGAPAAAGGEIREGDELVAVKPFEGDSPGWLPLDQLSLDELVQLVRGSAGTTVGLHLGNSSGQYEVALARAEFEAP